MASEAKCNSGLIRSSYEDYIRHELLNVSVVCVNHRNKRHETLNSNIDKTVNTLQTHGFTAQL